MNEFQYAKLPTVSELLPDSFVVALGIIKPKAMSSTAVELEVQLQVVQCSSHAETQVSSPIKNKEAAFEASSFWFRDSGHVNITVVRARGSTSMTLSQQNKPRRGWRAIQCCHFLTCRTIKKMCWR